MNSTFSGLRQSCMQSWGAQLIVGCRPIPMLHPGARGKTGSGGRIHPSLIRSIAKEFGTNWLRSLCSRCALLPTSSFSSRARLLYSFFFGGSPLPPPLAPFLPPSPCWPNLSFPSPRPLPRPLSPFEMPFPSGIDAYHRALDSS